MYFHLTHSLWLISPETLLKGWCPAHLPSGVFHRAPVELLRAVQTPGSILTTVPEWLRPTLCFHSRRRYETLDVLLKSTSVRSHQSKAFSWFWTVFILYLCTLWSALLSVFWLAGTRLGILELKKNDLRKSVASTRVWVPLKKGDEELGHIGKIVWTVCSMVSPHHHGPL